MGIREFFFGPKEKGKFFWIGFAIPFCSIGLFFLIVLCFPFVTYLISPEYGLIICLSSLTASVILLYCFEHLLKQVVRILYNSNMFSEYGSPEQKSYQQGDKYVFRLLSCVSIPYVFFLIIR
jgi:hypothetical protein